MHRLHRLTAVLLAVTVLGATGARAKNDDFMDNLEQETIYHPVDAGYAEFLARVRGQVRFPRVTDSIRYLVDAQTESHSAKFRSSQLGRTIVKLGPILHATMQGSDAGGAFGNVTKASSANAAGGLLLVFSLTEFDVRNFRAFIQLTVSARRDEQEIMLRPYYGVGRPLISKRHRPPSQAMMASVRSSTKDRARPDHPDPGRRSETRPETIGRRRSRAFLPRYFKFAY